MLDFISHSPTQTERVGQRLGELLHAGDVVLLSGDLGVGKTQLVRGIAQGMGATDPVTSPSFVLMNEYRTGASHHHLTIYHIDLYRIDNPADVTSIGLDDVLQGDGVCLIEWAEHASAWLPTAHLAVQMSYLDETKRVVRFAPHGDHYCTLVDALKQTAFG